MDATKGRFLRWLDVPATASRYEISSDGKLLALHQGREFFRVIEYQNGKGKAEIKLEGDRDYMAPTVQDISFLQSRSRYRSYMHGAGLRLSHLRCQNWQTQSETLANEPLQRIAYAWEDYKGPAIETLPDNKG